MTQEILPKLYRIEVPLPNNPLKSINSYVFMSEERNLVVDTGFNREACRTALEKGFNDLNLDLLKTDFLSTHLHADHQGLIPTFVGEHSRTYMGKVDAQFMTDFDGWRKMFEYGAASGFPVKKLQDALINHPGHKHGPQRALAWTGIGDGDVLTIGQYDLQVIETPGHSWGHICLYEPRHKILLSGDHILGDITPNIQVWDKDDDPLNSYIRSLNKVASLEITRVLPGHRSLIDDCGKRIRELKAHHLARCNEVLDILSTQPHTAYDTASKMTWDITVKSWEEFPLMQKWFATGEAMAHLRYLDNKGFIRCHESPDAGERFLAVKNRGKLTAMDAH